MEELFKVILEDVLGNIELVEELLKRDTVISGETYTAFKQYIYDKFLTPENTQELMRFFNTCSADGVVRAIFVNLARHLLC